MSRPALRRDGNTPPIFWKMIISAACGGAVYLVSGLTHQPLEWSLMLSAFVSGIALVAQFLVDFDRSLKHVEDRLALHRMGIDDIVRESFLRINAATVTYSAIEASPVGGRISHLVQAATGLNHAMPNLALHLAQSEIDRVASFLRELGEEQVTYDGENHDWLLALTHEAVKSIDATSTTAVDGGREGFAGGFWTTSAGQRYLGAQRDAANRGVKIRRLFIVDSLQRKNDDDPTEFQQICRMQIEAHAEVRILDSLEIPDILRVSSTFDFILFDDLMSYEANPAPRLAHGTSPTIVNTQLIAREQHIQTRRGLFNELWEFGRPYD